MTNMRQTNTFVWAGVLAAATLVGSYGLACIFPFAALAALAALTLDRRNGALLVTLVWLTNQVVGFTLLSYPHDGQALAWGAAILSATLAGFFAAKEFASRTSFSGLVVPILALLTSIVGYQALMFAWAVLLDGLASSTPAIVAQVALNDALWFAALALLRFALDRVQLITPRPTQLLR